MVMRDKVVPNLPLIANTFYPPNQPSAKRLYRFGEMVGEMIDKWDTSLRVNVSMQIERVHCRHWGLES